MMAEISCGDGGYSKAIRHFLNMKQRCFLKGTKVLTESGRKSIEDIKVGDKVLSRNEQTGEQGYKRVSRLFRGETDTVVHLKIARKTAGEAAKKTAAKGRVGKAAKAASRRTAREPALARTRVRGRAQRRATAKRNGTKAASTDDGDGAGYDGGHDDDTDSSDDDEDPDDADPGSAAGESSPALLSPDASLEAGASIRCTPEHPFFVRGQGWVGADMLRVGDELVGDQGETLVVVEREIRREQARHYNFEVEDWHTYFVAEAEVDPGAWVHNQCDGIPDSWEVISGADTFSANRGLFGILAEIDEKGFVTTAIYTRVTDSAGQVVKSDVSGTTLLNAALEHFGDRVKGLRGAWTDGTNLDGLRTRFASNGGDFFDAAKSTWTGRRAGERGFGNVSFDLEHFSGDSAMSIRWSKRPERSPNGSWDLFEIDGAWFVFSR